MKLGRLWAVAAFGSLTGLLVYAQVTTLRVQVQLVNVFVNVTDAHGAPVPDLLKSNFTLTEDGIPQALAVFERQTDVPLSVVLAVDTSGSTRKDMGDEQRAAKRFAQALLTPRDQLALFEFNSEVREVVPFTADLRQVDDGLHRLGKGPATAFYDAIVLASQQLAARPGRRVLLVISDGSNTAGTSQYDAAMEAAQHADVRIYSLIDVPVEADAGRATGGEHAMITLSQETGGRALYVDQEGLDAAFRKVSDDLRTQYLLGYYPHPGRSLANPLQPPSGQHTIRIALQGAPAQAGDTAHYRAGYYRVPPKP